MAVGPGLALLARTRVPPVVLFYHGVGPAPAAGDPHGLLVSEATFAAHLDRLLELGYRLVDAGELSGGPAGGRGHSRASACAGSGPRGVSLPSPGSRA